jgi:hypothetical protein
VEREDIGADLRRGDLHRRRRPGRPSRSHGGATAEPRLEIVQDPAAWGQVFEDCVVQAFAEDGYPGPPSEPSEQGFRFLPDLDVDGDAVVSSPDLVRVMTLVGQGRRDVRDLGLLRRMFGCRVDPTSRTYVDCTSGGDPAP